MSSSEADQKMPSTEIKATGTCSAEDAFIKKLDLDVTYLLVDAGANLTNKKFARDLDGVIQRAQDAGKDSRAHLIQVSYIIN